MDGGSIPPISTTTAVVARCGPNGRPRGRPFVVSAFVVWAFVVWAFVVWEPDDGRGR